MTSSLARDSQKKGSAQRMRLHRLRRKKGLYCLTIELRASEIVTLIQSGFLPPQAHNDRAAIRSGLYRFLDQTLGVKR